MRRRSKKGSPGQDKEIMDFRLNKLFTLEKNRTDSNDTLPSGKSKTNRGSSGMSLEDDIKTTQEILQPLINKPVLKDKLLQKPPFRFIHDIFSQVTVATGFGEGLFEDRNELLDGKGIKDKQGKLGEYVNLYACFTLLCYQFHSDPPKA